MKPSIAKLVRELRDETGQSQSQFAKTLNVGKDTVAHWEAGVRNPNTWLLEKLCALAQRMQRQDLALKIIPRPLTSEEVAEQMVAVMEAGDRARLGLKSEISNLKSPGASRPDPYDQLFKDLRQIIDSGQSELIGQAEEVLARLADNARHMTRKRKRVK
jgi:DNA-binding XRE family transcriptional regulator